MLRMKRSVVIWSGNEVSTKEIKRKQPHEPKDWAAVTNVVKAVTRWRATVGSPEILADIQDSGSDGELPVRRLSFNVRQWTNGGGGKLLIRKKPSKYGHGGKLKNQLNTDCR